MTGILNTMVGAGGGSRYTVTIGNSGNNYGYNDGTPIGSISPASYREVTIKVVANDISANTFTVTLNGDQVQSFFTGIEVQKTDGTMQTYYTSSTSFFSGGLTTIWQWNTASDLWTATSPATRLIRIF